MVCNKCGEKRPVSQKSYNKKVSELRYNINKAFDNFFNIIDYPLTSVGDLSIVEPKIDIIEKNGSVDVIAELPGIDEDDVDISLSEDGFLTIQAEKKHHFDNSLNGMYMSECSYGMIKRTVALPVGVDVNRAKANFKEGVLKISMPRTLNIKQKIKRIQLKK